MVAVLLALLSAANYGAGDFCAGIASRRFASAPVSAATQTIAFVAAVAALAILHPRAPSAAQLWWGAASGIGSGVGVLALYRGLAAGQMSVTATLSAVLAAVIPAIVGLALGNRLTLGAATGIAIAVPAIAMVSWVPGSADPRAVRAGVIYGALAGVGFALLFIALDRAGTRAGAWPLIPSQFVAVVLVSPFAWREATTAGRPAPRTVVLMVAGGVLGGVANVLFLAATGHGQLAIVAVVTSLYPSVTIVLARLVVGERWSRVQAVGLLTAAAAIVLVTIS